MRYRPGREYEMSYGDRLGSQVTLLQTSPEIGG